ncbi:Protein of unknown function [Clostridium collagenovorans DSM 3089]|uniref:DUF1292 domain-containing protein n=1 Tax=Clostridium collagenovorans DSM 3089 TaxID=1121306 RepID=A0A1M5TJ65_9CLOT|nr:DUF1292 domain-containing protein [Clostridium collagenovorans]SHH50744.1 Protein of unknown function [Clostridium collagenovorans DSM 3089]
MENSNLMQFKDDKGNLIEMELVYIVPWKNKEYALLSPKDDKEEAFVYRVEYKDNNRMYYPVYDDKEVQGVIKQYERFLEIQNNPQFNAFAQEMLKVLGNKN